VQPLGSSQHFMEPEAERIIELTMNSKNKNIEICTEE
jgi:hypothetical protein